MYRCASAASQTRLSSMRDSNGCTEGMGQQTTRERGISICAYPYLYVLYVNTYACRSVDPPHRWRSSSTLQRLMSFHALTVSARRDGPHAGGDDFTGDVTGLLQPPLHEMAAQPIAVALAPAGDCHTTHTKAQRYIGQAGGR